MGCVSVHSCIYEQEGAVFNKQTVITLPVRHYQLCLHTLHNKTLERQIYTIIFKSRYDDFGHVRTIFCVKGPLQRVCKFIIHKSTNSSLHPYKFDSYLTLTIGYLRPLTPPSLY